MRKTKILFVVIATLITSHLQAQVDDNQTGAWYMYFWNTTIGESPFGFQGDVQYRNWNMIGDLEQLLLRGGATYKPKNADIKFTLGYAHIGTGEFGEGKEKVNENRIYQEALIPHKVGERFYFTHRFRYEQRWVEGQDFRSRYRYNLFINVALNKKVMEQGTLYLAFYNELFINGELKIGDGRTVQYFDRNRTYLALGYGLLQNLNLQIGMMRQSTVGWQKNQTQLSLHHKF